MPEGHKWGLEIGTGLNGNNLFNSGELTENKTITTTATLGSSGDKVYVKLIYGTNTNVEFEHFEYTAYTKLVEYRLLDVPRALNSILFKDLNDKVVTKGKAGNQYKLFIDAINQTIYGFTLNL